MHTSANGRSTSGRANYAKKPSTNKDPQVADVHQQQDSEEGPPAKKRRTDTSHDSAIGDAAVTRAKSGNLVEPGKTWKTRKSLSIDQLERIGPRPLTEPPPGKQHKNDVRVLRSQDGTGHGTSALSAYFEEYYNEVFGGEDSSRTLLLVDEENPTNFSSQHSLTSTRPSTWSKKVHLLTQRPLPNPPYPSDLNWVTPLRLPRSHRKRRLRQPRARRKHRLRLHSIPPSPPQR